MQAPARPDDRISTLHALVRQAESRWRHTHLPPPTRDRPRPDPDALRVARQYEEAGRLLDLIGGQRRSAPRAGHAPDDALLAHVEFLIALAGPDGSGLDPAELLSSLAHLHDLSRRASGGSTVP